MQHIWLDEHYADSGMQREDPRFKFDGASLKFLLMNALNF